MRYGIIGGTFNPFHEGHLRTGLEIMKSAGIDRLSFIPTCIPPHKKDNADIASALHRYTMAVLGTMDYENIIVDPVEIESGDVSYTIETVSKYKDKYSGDNEVVFITGIESFEKITTWKNWEQLLDAVPFIVNTRSGYKTGSLFHYLPENVGMMCTLLKDFSVFKEKLESSNKVYIIQTEEIDISGSKVRTNIAEGKSITNLVHPEVEKYILKYKLYSKSEDS